MEKIYNDEKHILCRGSHTEADVNDRIDSGMLVL